MSGLFYHLGRTVGLGVIPTVRKSRWLWRSLTGDSAEALRAEGEFGQALAAELRMKVGTSHDAQDLDLLRNIIRRLAACVRNKERRFQVDIARLPECTALALPGGYIFVGTGLLDFCHRDPQELAFVIGHEMGHILRGHALDRVVHRIGTEGLSAILSRGLLNPVLRQTGLKWLQSAHSQEAEFEADEFGVRVAAAAGYDRTAAVTLLQRLQRLRNEPAGLSDYFASHPPEAQRIENLSALNRQLASNKSEPS
jgi:beta-barrel assembly-enhancing protease